MAPPTLGDQGWHRGDGKGRLEVIEFSPAAVGPGGGASFIARGRRAPDPAKTGAGPDPASPRRSAARPCPTARATPADPHRAAPPHPPRTEPLGQPLVGIAASPCVVSRHHAPSRPKHRG